MHNALLYVRDNQYSENINEEYVNNMLNIFSTILNYEDMSIDDGYATDIAKLLIALQEQFPSITEFDEEIAGWKLAISKIDIVPSRDKVASAPCFTG